MAVSILSSRDSILESILLISAVKTIFRELNSEVISDFKESILLSGRRIGICQWKLDTFKNNLDSNHRVFSVFGLLIQAATGALGGLGDIPLNRSG